MNYRDELDAFFVGPQADRFRGLDPMWVIDHDIRTPVWSEHGAAMLHIWRALDNAMPYSPYLAPSSRRL